MSPMTEEERQEKLEIALDAIVHLAAGYIQSTFDLAAEKKIPGLSSNTACAICYGAATLAAHSMRTSIELEVRGGRQALNEIDAWLQPLKNALAESARVDALASQTPPASA